jgi:tetratricopeptide (TPR) repeat protein
LEELAKLLSGGLEQEKVVTDVVPHLLERCPVCRERYQEILRLQEEVGHWSEEVAVFEGREAPLLWARLAGLTQEEQVRLIEEEESLHSWGLCQLLLKKSIEAAFGDPALAIRLANLAVRASAHLGEVYDPHWVMDLRARALAYLGNARRVLGEFQSAEDAFRKAEGWLRESRTGNPLVEAEILSLKASLRRDQRRFREALEQVERALALYRENGNENGAGKTLLSKAKILEEMGNLDQAIELLRPPEEIDLVREPRLFAYARYNLLGCLTLAGRHQEAERLLPEIRDLFRDTAQPLDLVRLHWAEGLIDLGLGRLGPAEAALREVQREFAARGMGYDAALVSLDLALLYAREGCVDALKRLAVELMPVFGSREIHREAVAALLLFQHACEEERASAELVRQVAAFLRRERRGGGG